MGDKYFAQSIDGFVRTRIHNVSDHGADVPNKEEIISGFSTVHQGAKVHLDTTPVRNGVEYPGDSDEIRNLTKLDDKSPCIEWKWTVDGKEASNSAQVPDPFALGSYENDGGCTPTLRLDHAFGEGRHEVKVWPFIRAEFNGGVAVEGDPVTFYID